ncbi:uncharacterized protein C2845_PM02G17700 [Panicum miliaceum]|uniref:F-box domain-containing protein n=1 Tax=Panicum miliaceum TaxID=4540 RepID=A0A3L6S5D3_PANMI|nr:uncharacterized protein C2845_PM02G17700 [Panicum miliaceum]
MSKRLGTRSRSLAVDLVPDDLLLDIFLRLPPDPRHLLVASLVCKRWRRLIRNPAFVVRFRAFHRAIPVLGFYQNINGLIRFFPIAAPAPRLSAPQEFQNWMCWVLDCRHGRVLIYDDSYESLFIWDPMAATSSHVGSLPELSGEENFAAVLVCTPGNDDHTDCHSAPFRIVYVDNSDDDEELLVSVRVFSSETGAWGDWLQSHPHPSLAQTRRRSWVVLCTGSLILSRTVTTFLGFEWKLGNWIRLSCQRMSRKITCRIFLLCQQRTAALVS